MHPYLMEALARQHRAELLRQQHFRDRRAATPASSVDATPRPIGSVRRSLGTALVLAGTRLMTGRDPTAEWAVRAPADVTLR
ncbi:MAG TPA: hypothetical protein VN796_02005 [Acidimicrobiales bacterium]|nr:hypothetical protein [Acidimicrobiales bacterium]